MTKKNINITFDTLYKNVSSYIKNTKELNIIKEAYDYVSNLYEGVTRLTGDPYVEHLLNVALILSEIKADYETIAAGLLHDTIEVGNVSELELKNKFGENITTLVNGVTKINKLKLNGDTNLSIANHRKILVGLSKDVRVIIIKLADRLHNMRTLYVLPRDRQKNKAKETLDILTPIAHRLGMSHIKGELEDLSLRYLKPDAYFSIVEKLNQTKIERDKCVTEMINSVSDILNKNNIDHKIKGRSKSIYSIYKKLDKGKKFSDIYDLLALRVFVNTKEECYQVLGLIHSIYKPLPKRFKDYVAMPKTNMYQSLHTTVIGIDGNLFEVQIRTYEMDKIAEHGIAAHWSYKEQGSNKLASMQSEMEQKLQFFRNMIELSNEEENDEQFVNIVKEELFKENVYVFTKDGDVIELPLGSTPIDFAYRLHTNIGDHMVGAIVNGNIVSLDYKLNDNDVIKINTSNNTNGPSREWLNIVKTTHARNKIKSFFNKIEKDEAKNNGIEELNKELKKRKISNSDFYKDDNIKEILEFFKYNNIDELYINLGLKKITVNQIFNITNNEIKSKEEIILNKVLNNSIKKDSTNKHDIIVSGIDEIKVNIASCCNPIPKDKIVGFITKGNGVTIHRSICPNIKDVENRLIDVKWNEKIEKKYQSSIMVYANKYNILLEIVSKSSNTDVVIHCMNTMKSGTNTMYEITVMVKDNEELNKFINSILNIDGVISVERIIR